MRIELEDILKYFPKRTPLSHKGTYGKILNIAGSKLYTGAAILSSVSALKVGAGYVTLACPDTICAIISSFSPDITLLPLNNTNGFISASNTEIVANSAEKYDVISIGSGLSQNEDTQKFVLEFFKNIKKPCIIDADALNAISSSEFLNLPQKSVITPHPMELSRMLKISVEKIQEQREYYAKLASNKYNSVVVLKGHETIVTDGKRTYTNKSGNSALAKAGSGDVLTGMIAGISAQTKGENLFECAALAVYLHGYASDIAVKETTEYGLLASELINYIPKAIKKII